MLYKLYNTEEIEHIVCIFYLPPLFTVLQGPWRRMDYIHIILIVNRYMYSVHCTTVKLIQILQFALTCGATLISELIFRYAIIWYIRSSSHENIFKRLYFYSLLISFIALSSMVNAGPFKNYYPLTRNKQIHIYSII